MITLEQAYRTQARYRANESIREQLHDTSLVAIVGATAVGKNFLMRASRLPLTGTLTSREPRHDDDPKLYTYESTEQILRQVQEGTLVQYGVALPRHVYGSRLTHYKLGEPNVTDIWHDAVASLANKGFKTVRSVSVLTPKTQWFHQLRMRWEGQPVCTVTARLAESRHSIRWSLANHFGRIANHLVIINTADSVDENVARFRDFAMGNYVSPLNDGDVQDTANDMAEVVDTMYKRIGA